MFILFVQLHQELQSTHTPTFIINQALFPDLYIFTLLHSGHSHSLFPPLDFMCFITAFTLHVTYLVNAQSIISVSGSKAFNMFSPMLSKLSRVALSSSVKEPPKVTTSLATESGKSSATPTVAFNKLPNIIFTQ